MTDFEDYVRGRGGALLRFAYLLCGDAHRAEDLVQEALIRCHRKWRRIEPDVGPDAYVHKAILRQYLSWRRRKAATEQITDHFHGAGDRGTWPAGAGGTEPGGGEAEAIGDRDEMWRLLRRLPARQRAVLVLRFYEDLPDAEIADLLGCSAATVRVHARRGLARLRDRFHELEAVRHLEENV